MILFAAPPVTHPTARICSGPDILCVVNWDSILSSAIAVACTLLVGFLVANRLSARVPGKLQLAFELLAGYTRRMIHDNVSEDAMFIMPIALTLFFYILIANWIDFLPLPDPIHPANSDLNQTLAMAALVIVVVQWYSLRTLGLRGYLHRFTKPFDAPIWLRSFFVPLNIIEEVTKPITLSLRLMGNIFGGLVMLWVLTVLVPAIPIIFPQPVWWAASVVLVGVWKAFDVFFVGTIQAFIFFLLTIIYFEMAREGLEGEHGHGAPSPGSATTT